MSERWRRVTSDAPPSERIGGATVSMVEQLEPGRRRTLAPPDFSALTSPDFATVLESDPSLFQSSKPSALDPKGFTFPYRMISQVPAIELVRRAYPARRTFARHVSQMLMRFPW
jgi:hypothetical protein